jgi:WhiB family redox-sensing transcriptional regulator
MQECREHALRVQEPYGTWGGLTEDERQILLTSGRSARPLERGA